MTTISLQVAQSSQGLGSGRAGGSGDGWEGTGSLIGIQGSYGCVAAAQGKWAVHLRVKVAFKLSL